MNAEEVLDHEGHSSDERGGARFLRFCIRRACAFCFPSEIWILSVIAMLCQQS